MRIGLSTPRGRPVPGVCSDWERGAGMDELVSVAATADALGFDHMTCSEHVAVPVDLAAQRGATYWDPVATRAYLAACTRHIRLATSVVVLGYHHPLELAKTYGTLDRVSGGRPLDPLGDPGGTRGRLRALSEVGATVVTAAVSAESCDHYCDQLGMLRKLAGTIPDPVEMA